VGATGDGHIEMTGRSIPAAAQDLSEAGLRPPRSVVDRPTGPNEPVTPAQITDAFGTEQIASLRCQGRHTTHVATRRQARRKNLPRAFDRSVPDGHIVEDATTPTQAAKGVARIVTCRPRPVLEAVK